MDELNSTSSDDDSNKMNDLLNAIHEIQKCNENPKEGIIRMHKILHQSSEIVETSARAMDVLVDAEILHTGLNCFSDNVSSLDTNLFSFVEETYIKHILNIIECYKNDKIAIEEDTEWESLAPYTYHLLRKSEPITFMLGPLSLKPFTSQDSQNLAEQKKAEKLKMTGEGEKNILELAKEKEESEEESNDIYQHILKYLVKNYKKNNKEPINYFAFIVDPTDYWKTVQNIFFFSFLIRDGNVKIAEKNGFLVVEPILKKLENSLPNSNNSQFCLSLSVSDWKECVKKFQIQKPSIPPYVTKRGGG